LAFTGVAALIAAAGTETAITATMVLSAVAEVGTAMTVVGAVTGSKDLMQVGGAMSLVGGVGGMVAGAADAGAAGAAVNAGSDAYSAGQGAEGLGNPFADAAGGAADAATSDVASAAAGAGSDAVTQPIDPGSVDATDLAPAGSDAQSFTSAGDTTTADAASPSPQSAQQAVAPTNETPIAQQTPTTDSTVAGQTAAAQPLQAAPDVSTPAGAGSTPPINQNPAFAQAPGAPAGSITNPTDARLANGTQMAPSSVTSPQDATYYWNKMMSFMQDPKNKTVLQMGEKLVGGALQGARQQSQFQQKLDLENRRLAQTSYGSQVGQNGPRAGIIMGARK
jgi:hypothetical protein